MLIEFSVANFLSIKERQTLSLVAARNKELANTHTFDAPIAAKDFRLLRSAVIYGANAAGKSNLLLAIRNMRDIVVYSALDKFREEPLSVLPFMLDSKTRNEPSEFEIQFIVEDVRYQYGFSTTRERVMEEWLIAYPKNRARHLFTREWSAEKEDYQWEFSGFLTGEKNTWKKATRDNALFLSTAVQLNSEQLYSVYDWFKTNMLFFGKREWEWQGNLKSILDKEGAEPVLNFLRDADMDIHGFQMKKRGSGQGQSPDDVRDRMRQYLTEYLTGSEVYKITTTHLDTDEKPVEFNLGYESLGTGKMFAITGYWLAALNSGRVIFADDLHDHLHLELLKFVVNQFHSNKNNPYNAQLVFATHETALLNQNIMRRDQIWFCEKNRSRETIVYPLTDFRPHKGRENLQLGYLSGGYGALPYIKRM